MVFPISFAGGEERGIPMAGRPNSKLVLLHIMKALIERTDENHDLTLEDIGAYLAEHDLEAEGKKIVRDLDALREFGFDIDSRRGGNNENHYFLATRPLEMEQLMLLADALQSTPAITENMTDYLISQLRQFASESQREALDRQIQVPGRVKMVNEGTLRNVDIIQDAMRKHKQVKFRYKEYNDAGELVFRREKPYEYTPLALVYIDEYYYLMCFNAYFAEKNMRWANPYRVDRMVEVEVSEEDFADDPRITGFKLEDYVTPSFGVYAADKKTVELEFTPAAGRTNAKGWPLRSPMNVIVDKFGTDVRLYPGKDGKVKVVAKAPFQPQFWGWLMEINASENSAGIKLVGPSEAVNAYKGWLKAQLEMYEEPEEEEAREQAEEAESPAE